MNVLNAPTTVVHVKVKPTALFALLDIYSKKKNVSSDAALDSTFQVLLVNHVKMVADTVKDQELVLFVNLEDTLIEDCAKLTVQIHLLLKSAA